MRLVETIRFRRGKLPHWEVAGGRYFVTFRLADSLPSDAVARLKEIHASNAGIVPRSTEAAALQRRHFLALEKYLDAAAGACLLRRPEIAALVAGELDALGHGTVDVPHYTIMPNHCHVIIVPRTDCGLSLADLMKQLKGRTAALIRRRAGGAGPVWQREWFDRWIRDDAEWSRVVAYIRNNPVKAHLCERWQDHRWTR